MNQPISSADRLRSAATGQVAKRVPESLPEMLNAYGSQIAAALPRHITKERMIRIALTAFRQNPKLAACDPKSVFACVIMSAQLGLEVGVLGQAYLVPYKQRDGSFICTFIPGWQGLQDLVNRSGRATTWTGAVYAGDEFDYEYGSSPMIHHKPCGEDDPAAMTHAYAIGRVRGGEYPIIEVWPALKIKRHRDRYNKVGDKHYSYENAEMYARKVPLMQVFKYVPKSVEMATALGLDFAADAGTQMIDLKDAVEGNFLPPVAEQDPAQETEKTGSDAGNGAMPSTGSTESVDPRREIDQPGIIATLRKAATTDELATQWDLVRSIYKAAGKEIPIDIEACKHDHGETLKQREAKATKGK
jgi:recombination protein RecT